MTQMISTVCDRGNG